ncbi:MAG TPA: DUF4412 domain-containing protein [Bacteroidia bacterium]|nr:DUF4412 domain-containing protein [Sphingobacteriales bacterium]HPD66124.1 DUF4412 domain-containing protein [Bacteroidia bacterium]HRS59838.1 DUF4412 domain-containing protein [Bacteroidia bacterium]HRU68935.1 DUF4412 domain-containing protein [Bacteroidia bacterium]
MKKFILLIPIILLLSSFSGDKKIFEGTIVFKMDVEGDFMSMMKSYLPDSYVFSFKDENVRIRIKGGLLEMMAGNILVTKSGDTYLINDEEKTAWEIKAAGKNTEFENREAPKVIKLNESEEILGYHCEKYKIVMNEGGNEIVQYIWATDQLSLKMKGLESAGVPGYFNYEGLDAFPLKIQMNVDQMGFNMNLILRAVDIKNEKFKSSEFQIPKNYTIKPFENNFLNF